MRFEVSLEPIQNPQELANEYSIMTPNRHAVIEMRMNEVQPEIQAPLKYFKTFSLRDDLSIC